MGGFTDTSQSPKGYAFVHYASGGSTTFTIPGAQQTWATGIDDSCDIFGTYFDSNTNVQGFLRYASGNYATLSVAGASSTDLQGVDGAGDAYGVYTDSTLFKQHLFVRSASGTVSTFDLPNVSLISMITVRAVNSAGEITGDYKPDGVTSIGFFATPAVQTTPPRDFNGDGKSDILWRNANGADALWQSNGSGGFNGVNLWSADASWQVAGVGDFNGDGKSDILWRNTGGADALWQSNNSGGFTGVTLWSADTSWQIQKA